MKAPFLNLDLVAAKVKLMTMEFQYFESGGERIAVTRHMEDFFGVEQAPVAQGATSVD